MRRGCPALLALPLLLAACSGRPPAEAPLRPPSDFAVDFLLRQELTFRRGEVERRMQTALQRRGDRLVLIGLTPMGTRAFVLEQRGQAVSFTSHLPEGGEPFPARQVLVDIQRTLLPVLSAAPLTEGEHEAEVEGERVVERWRGGRLQERRLGDEVVITYGAGGLAAFDEAPGPIAIDNRAMGYHLSLTTLAYQELPPPP